MLYPDGHRVDHWRIGSSVPDMSKLETRMWFFYLAARYIDIGVEAIHFGQVEIMDDRDPDHSAWRDMMARVRQYAAKHSRRHFLLADAHVPSGGIVHDERLLFDFHSFPLRIDEVVADPQKGVLKAGYLDSIFTRSKGGITPSGWNCDSLPSSECTTYGATTKSAGSLTNLPTTATSGSGMPGNGYANTIPTATSKCPAAEHWPILLERRSGIGRTHLPMLSPLALARRKQLKQSGLKTNSTLYDRLQFLASGLYEHKQCLLAMYSLLTWTRSLMKSSKSYTKIPVATKVFFEVLLLRHAS